MVDVQRDPRLVMRKEVSRSVPSHAVRVVHELCNALPERVGMTDELLDAPVRHG